MIFYTLRLDPQGGPFPNEEEAIAEALKLAAHHGVEYVVVRLIGGARVKKETTFNVTYQRAAS